MVEMRSTMAIVFITFTYLYLDCFQDDVMAVAQYVLSGGMTSYSYVLAPIILTLALFMLQVGVCTLTQVMKRFHALTYFPSMLMLTVLTDIPTDFDKHHSLGAWWWIIPLLLVIWGAGMWVARQVEPFEPLPHREGWLTKVTWQNLLQLLVMLLLTVLVANGDRVFHQRMKMERLMKEGRYDEALKVGCKSQDTDSSLTMLRIACLHRCGSMGEHLFEYPLMGGSKAMIPDGVTVKAMMWKAPRWMKQNVGSKKRQRVPKDYLLCGLLLDKKLDRFVAEVKRTYIADSLPLPKHYKEALVLYVHRRTHPMVVFHDDVMDADFQDYQVLEHKYSDVMQKKAALRDTYGNTYWYYYQYGDQ